MDKITVNDLWKAEVRERIRHEDADGAVIEPFYVEEFPSFDCLACSEPDRIVNASSFKKEVIVDVIDIVSSFGSDADANDENTVKNIMRLAGAEVVRHLYSCLLTANVARGIHFSCRGKRFDNLSRAFSMGIADFDTGVLELAKKDCSILEDLDKVAGNTSVNVDVYFKVNGVADGDESVVKKLREFFERKNIFSTTFHIPIKNLQYMEMLFDKAIWDDTLVRVMSEVVSRDEVAKLKDVNINFNIIGIEAGNIRNVAPSFKLFGKDVRASSVVLLSYDATHAVCNQTVNLLPLTKIIAEEAEKRYMRNKSGRLMEDVVFVFDGIIDDVVKAIDKYFYNHPLNKHREIRKKLHRLLRKKGMAFHRTYDRQAYEVNGNFVLHYAGESMLSSIERLQVYRRPEDNIAVVISNSDLPKGDEYLFISYGFVVVNPTEDEMDLLKYVTAITMLSVRKGAEVVPLSGNDSVCAEDVVLKLKEIGCI